MQIKWERLPDLEIDLNITEEYLVRECLKEINENLLKENNMEAKQVIVMRKDLNMRKGKIAAQAAHASMKALLDLGSKNNDEIIIPFVNDAMHDWLNGAFKKICVYVNSEEELMNVYNKAEERGLIRSLIIDKGLTEFNGIPTKTCIAIGPEYSDVLDEITGDLPLY